MSTVTRRWQHVPGGLRGVAMRGLVRRATVLARAAVVLQRAGEALDRAASTGHLSRSSLSAAGATAPASVAAAVAPRSVCRREGEYWSIAFAGEAFWLKDVKGLHYLAQLLRNPGREFHVLDLAAAGQGAGSCALPVSPAPEDDLRPARLSGTGPILDQQAKTAYRARLCELEEELAEATAWADPVRAARARHEMQFLAGELAAAVGLGGRDRQAGSAAERARVNITRALRTALARIRACSPALADHLDATIHTGTFCSYTPDPRIPVTWHTDRRISPFTPDEHPFPARLRLLPEPGGAPATGRRHQRATSLAPTAIGGTLP